MLPLIVTLVVAPTPFNVTCVWLKEIWLLAVVLLLLAPMTIKAKLVQPPPAEQTLKEVEPVLTPVMVKILPFKLAVTMLLEFNVL